MSPVKLLKLTFGAWVAKLRLFTEASQPVIREILTRQFCDF